MHPVHGQFVCTHLLSQRVPGLGKWQVELPSGGALLIGIGLPCRSGMGGAGVLRGSSSAGNAA